MSTAVALMTVEEFLRLPEKEDVRIELIEGVPIEMGRAALGHENVKSRFIEFLMAYLHDHPIGRVFSETTFVLSEDSAPIPDVAFVLANRLANRDPHKQFAGAPDLPIEVVSSETAAQLEAKIRSYLRFGAKAVWVAYPEQRIVHVHHPDGTSRRLEGDQILEAPDLLPGFQVKVAAIFQDL